DLATGDPKTYWGHFGTGQPINYLFCNLTLSKSCFIDNLKSNLNTTNAREFETHCNLLFTNRAVHAFAMTILFAAM
ncbi:hypothetical protein CSKR_202257, partial [Clonorchis sinensis]